MTRPAGLFWVKGVPDGWTILESTCPTLLVLLGLCSNSNHLDRSPSAALPCSVLQQPSLKGQSFLKIVYYSLLNTYFFQKLSHTTTRLIQKHKRNAQWDYCFSGTLESKFHLRSRSQTILQGSISSKLCKSLEKFRFHELGLWKWNVLCMKF